MRAVTTQEAHLCRLDLLRRLLISHYTVVEAGYPQSVDPNSSNNDIYDHFTRLFSTLKTVSHDLVLDFIPESTKSCWRERIGSVLGLSQQLERMIPEKVMGGSLHVDTERTSLLMATCIITSILRF
jgi:hypothetical protein